MKVDKHISELLYQHNCVIVPNFGGFVTNYSAAKIHPTQHTFTPPSKNIVFNKNLSSNDGLLANRIASVSKTSYPDALNTISEFVTVTNTQLKKGEKVIINEVGTLHLDVERNIQFVPAATNYLVDAFGLNQFQSPAIKRENISKRIEKEFKDRDALPAERKKINVKRIATIAVLIPFIFAVVWIPLKTDLLKNINYSNLNPFASNKVAVPVVIKKAVAPKLKVKARNIVPATITNDTLNTQPVTASLINDNIAEHVKADTTSVAVKNSIEPNNMKFHLVTGCFQIEQNAINFVNDLRSQNIQASVIGQRNGLYVVSCGNYATRKEALDSLTQLKNNQPNAWLMKN
jgi:cell division septation protein DedD